VREGQPPHKAKNDVQKNARLMEFGISILLLSLFAQTSNLTFHSTRNLKQHGSATFSNYLMNAAEPDFKD